MPTELIVPALIGLVLVGVGFIGSRLMSNKKPNT